MEVSEWNDFRSINNSLVGNGYAVNITINKNNFIRPNVTIEVNMN